MISDILKYTLIFFLVVLLQVLLFNNMHYSVYINPYFYILFILILPFETPNWLLLILGFVTGFTIDAFMDSEGIHASACVFLAFTRPYILNFIAPRDGYEFGLKPRVKYMGWVWFLTYISIEVMLHHIFLFFVDSFSMANFFLTLFKVVFSSIFTLLLIIISELLVTNR